MGYLDHIDPGNSGGSVRIPDTPFKSKSKPVVFPCDICGKTFKTHESLVDHRIEVHPIKRPMLYVDCRPLRKENITIRTAMVPGSITLQDVDSIFLNDKEVMSEEALLGWLCKTTPAAFDLKLVNQSYPVTFRWVIDIASSDELDKVDSLFYGAFRSGLSIYQAFGLFNEQVSGVSSAAKNYAAGLSCYVVAIITKDQLPGATLAFEKYPQKLGEAMDTLCDYRGRALSDAVFAIAEFMQNDFQPRSSDYSLPKLYAAKQFFTCGEFQGVDSRANEVQSIPIDTVTDCIVDFCSMALASQSANILNMDALMKSLNTDARDRAKIVFVQWSYFRLSGESDKANDLKSKLTHDPYFSSLVEVIGG
jgi:hypothetical protein